MGNIVSQITFRRWGSDPGQSPRAADPEEAVAPVETTTPVADTKDIPIIQDRDVDMVSEMSPGLIKFAAEQCLYDNLRVQPSFSVLRRAQILYLQTKIVLKESEALKQIAKRLDGNPAPEAQTGGQDKCCPGGSTTSQARAEEMAIEESIRLTNQYNELLRVEGEMRKLPRVPVMRHDDMVLQMKRNGLSDELIMSFQRADDLVDMDRSHSDSFTDWLIHYCPWIIPRLTAPDGMLSINQDRVEFWCRIIAILVPLAAMLLPVSLLYMLPMSKGESLAVSITAVVLVAFFVSQIPGITYQSQLICILGYMAIMVPFVAQLQNNCTCTVIPQP
ncbi:uncharacterized protein E0L32_008651 [Thyridium curvatum]|uniref:DUF6594 domain-containing protein n=1 Tax=Thyridium curvatum TaxID=1093900 RepID=A0A507AL69_9PEZI|nr:uncharacterized protein E0L32_008651 [Thyridium curvatum]TPX10432.1 hypothetical protein E0L32_008651 [Thyridium curvatum]